MDRRRFLQALGVAAATGTVAQEASGATRRKRHGIATPSGFDPVEHSLAELQQAQTQGRTSAESLVNAYLARIERFDRAGPRLRAVLATNPRVLADARALDAERRAGHVRGPLHGLPLIIKDNIETRDPMATTAGSLALAHSLHGRDAPLVARLRAAGALVLGKGNLSEWANFRSGHSQSGWSAVGGQTRNAYDPLRNPSGSSAGSAVATAANLCAAAIGSETDGSILSPAALNGCVGLKPSAGLVSGAGIVPLSPRQDCAGPIGRTVADVAALAAVIAERPLGYGPQGSDLESFRLAGVRLGWMPTSRDAHPDSAVRYDAARRALVAEGAVVVDLALPKALDEMGDAERVAMQTEFKAAINEYLATLDPKRVPSRTLTDLVAFNRAHHAEELAFFGQETFEASDARGSLTDSAYRDAVAVLERCADREGLAALLSSVDVLVAPGPGPADLIDPVWGERPGDGGWPPIASAAAIAGYPSITVPAGLVRGLPVGMVFVARRNEDGLLLQVARAFERATKARVAPTLGA
jgi:amidase